MLKEILMGLLGGGVVGGAVKGAMSQQSPQGQPNRRPFIGGGAGGAARKALQNSGQNNIMRKIGGAGAMNPNADRMGGLGDVQLRQPMALAPKQAMMETPAARFLPGNMQGGGLPLNEYERRLRVR